MTCEICRQGRAHGGTATVTLERNGLKFVMRGVPVRVCECCGEGYLDQEMVASLLRDAERAAYEGVQVGTRTGRT